MLQIDISKLSDEQLTEYDQMMIESALKIEKFAEIAVAVWSATLKELDRRGKVTLVSGAYDSPGDAHINRG